MPQHWIEPFIHSSCITIDGQKVGVTIIQSRVLSTRRQRNRRIDVQANGRIFFSRFLCKMWGEIFWWARLWSGMCKYLFLSNCNVSRMIIRTLSINRIRRKSKHIGRHQVGEECRKTEIIFRQYSWLPSSSQSALYFTYLLSVMVSLFYSSRLWFHSSHHMTQHAAYFNMHWWCSVVLWQQQRCWFCCTDCRLT